MRERADPDLGWLVAVMEERLRAAQPPHLWVAVSGGIDSMVLLELCVLLQARGAVPQVGVLHVNYQLRGGESDGDALFVQDVCAQRQVECRVLKVDPKHHPAGGHGVQDWARSLRYRWFYEQMGKHDWLVLGHHADDLVETILMRIARGSGLEHLLGMREREGQIWRPLLEVRRSAIEEWARRQKIQHRVDSSNDKLVYSRNVLRLKILPELERMYPGVRQNLIHLASDAAALAGFYQDPRLEQGDVLRSDQVRGQPPVLVQQAIGRFLRRQGVQGAISRQHRQQLARALQSGHTLVLPLDRDHRAVVRSERLSVETSDLRRSTRWLQYARAVEDATPRVLLAPGDAFEDLMPLDAGPGMADNDSIDPPLVRKD